MSLWRKLFPKYACRRCRDTFVVEGRYFIARCDCPAAEAELHRHLQELSKQIARLEREGRLQEFLDKVIP